MKASTNLLQAEKCRNEETPKKAVAGRLLKYLLFFFMFLQVFLLYSCTVGLRTSHSHHHSSGVVVYDNNESNVHHDNGLHKGQYKNK
jgi:hypothetical protein